MNIENINIVNDKTSFVEIDKSEGSPIPKFFRSSDNQIYFTKELLAEMKCPISKRRSEMMKIVGWWSTTYVL